MIKGKGGSSFKSSMKRVHMCIPYALSKVALAIGIEQLD